MNVNKKNPSNRAALVGATIIDGNGGAPVKDGVIIIEGNRIRAVGDRSTAIPPDARVISVEGKFIIPGFIGDGLLIRSLYPFVHLLQHEGQLDEIAIEGAQLALAGGITTLFEVYGPRDDLIKARNAINDGKAIGPRIRLCGNWIGYVGLTEATWVKEVLPPSILDNFTSRWVCNVPDLSGMSPAEVRGEIRKYIEPGVDYLTVIATGNYGPGIHHLRFSPRVIKAMVEEAHQAGIPVHVNCTYSFEALQAALDAGADRFYITPSLPKLIPGDLLEQIVKRQMVMYSSPFGRVQMEYMTKRAQTASHLIELHKGFPENYYANERALKDAGVPRYFGSAVSHSPAYDREHALSQEAEPQRLAQPGIGVLGKHHFTMFEAGEETGMKPMEILQAATRNWAKSMKVDKDLGTLEAGKLADLLVLDRDPLASAKNFSSINLIMKDGDFIDREALPTKRILTAAA
jgi:imidazolonepropionase-like amidohydrolase